MIVHKIHLFLLCCHFTQWLWFILSHKKANNGYFDNEVCSEIRSGSKVMVKVMIVSKSMKTLRVLGSWEITSSKMRVKRYFLMSWTHSKLMNYGMSARTAAVSSGHILKRKQNVIMSQKWKKNTVFATEKTIFVKSAALRNKILCCKYKERTED